MNKQKRLTGRAIRKQRREQRVMLAAISVVDWEAVYAGMNDAFVEFGRVCAEAGEAMTRFAEAYTESIAQEYRMTHRALTAGTEVVV